MVKKKSAFFLLLRMQLRNIRKNIAQFLAIIVIGAIAVTLFVGLQSNAGVFENQIQTTFDEGRLPDIFVTTSSYDSKDEELLKSHLKEGDVFDKRIYVPGKIGNHDVYMVVTDQMPELSTAYGTIKQSDTATDDCFAFLDINFEDSKKQNVPEKYQLDEKIDISIDLSLFGIDVDSLNLPSSAVAEGGTAVFRNGVIPLPMTVTGFMQHPENITKANYNPAVCLVSYSMLKKSIKEVLAKNFNGFSASLIKIYLERTLGKGFLNNEKLDYYNQYLIRLSDKSRKDEFVTEIRNLYSAKENNNLLLVTGKEEMPFYITVYADATQAGQFTYAFPFVFFLVAVLVILTTLSQLILKDRTAIGTLKALGLKRREILFNYLALTDVLVTLGILLGFLLGPLIIPSILGQKYQILYSLPKRSYYFPVFFSLMTALGFLLVASLVTYIVARNELNLKPVDSMRPVVPNWKKLKHSPKKEKSVASLSLKMAFRNLSLDKFRSFMVIVGVLGCTALLVCGFGIEDTVNYGIKNDRNLFLSSDITLTMNDTYTKEELSQLVFDTEQGIQSVEPYRRREMTYYKEGGKQTTKILYILSGPSLSLGMEMPKDGIAISEKIADTIEAKLGDEIVLANGNTTRKIKVTKIFKAFYYNCAILPYDSPILTKEEHFYNGAWIHLDDGIDAKNVADRLQEQDAITQAISAASFADQIKDVMSGVLLMTNAVKVFAILLALVTLYNLALLTYRQRTRDMATLKVLGFRKREIALTLLAESITLTFIGVIFGMFLGYPFLLVVMKTNIVELVQYLFHISFLSYLYSFLLTFIVAIVINLYFANRTKKIPIVESLKAVE